MQLYNTEGIILRLYELSDADKIAVIISREYGKMSIVAKGARKMKSRFAGAVLPPSHAVLQLSSGKSMDILQQIDIQDQFIQIKNDLERISACYVMMELAEKAFVERQPIEGFFDFLLASLRFLSVTGSPALVCLAYEARLLSFLGYAMIHDECSACGETEFLKTEADFSFSPMTGGVLCPACRNRLLAENKALRSLNLMQVSLLSTVLNADAAALEKVSIVPYDYKCLSVLVRQSISWHLEQSIKAWRFSFLLDTL